MTTPFRWVRAGTDNRYVVLLYGKLYVYFDTYFGGAPLAWKYGVPPTPLDITENFPGTGFQNTIEEGQDPTQASANGLLWNKISRQIDPANNYRNYYAREVLTPNWPQSAISYRLAAFYPDFWLSAEAADDSIPPFSNGTQQDGWLMSYQGKVQPAIPTGTCPVFFRGTVKQESGILMEGNQMQAFGLWNERLRQIPNGRVAFKCRISLANASDTAWAGVMFRKTVPAGPGRTMDDVFNAPGYFLNINRNGQIDLLQSGGVRIWTKTLPLAKAFVNSSYGALIEFRTYNNVPERMEVWLENMLIGTVNLIDHETGPHIGLIAVTGRDTFVTFSDREIFNIGTEVQSTYTPMGDGSIRTELLVRNAPGVPASELRQLYRVNTVAFLHPGNDLHQIAYESPRGTTKETTDNGAYLPGILNGISPHADALWVGRNDHTLGLYCVPEAVEIVGGSLTHGEHALLQTPASPYPVTPICHLNACPPYQINSGIPPWTAQSVRLQARWWPVHP